MSDTERDGGNVLLYDLAGPAIIVEHETGIFYQNQTAGVACNQREAEGFLIPLPVGPDGLPKVFDDGWWYGTFYGIDLSGILSPEIQQEFPDMAEDLKPKFPAEPDLTMETVYDMIEAEFGGDESWRLVSGLRVVRDDPDNEEAWIACTFDLVRDRVGAAEVRERRRGRLTWPNCD